MYISMAKTQYVGSQYMPLKFVNLFGYRVDWCVNSQTNLSVYSVERKRWRKSRFDRYPCIYNCSGVFSYFGVLLSRESLANHDHKNTKKAYILNICACEGFSYVCWHRCPHHPYIESLLTL